MRLSASNLLLTLFVIAAVPAFGFAAEKSESVLLDDHFERSEKDDSKEEVGNGWGTNSKKRAKGVKQVDLVDGAMHITRAKVADHGVSVTHEASFRDAVISLRFKLGAKDDLGINIADMKEKSVHAGHICMTRIRLNKVDITDLKTGNMNLETRKKRLAKTITPEEQKQLKLKTKSFKQKLTENKWHKLEVKIVGDRMGVSINGKEVGRFQSPGIAHATKGRLRLAVGKSAWVDDVKIVRLKP